MVRGTQEMQVLRGMPTPESEGLGVVIVQKPCRAAFFERAAALIAEPNRTLYRRGDVARRWHHCFLFSDDIFDYDRSYRSGALTQFFQAPRFNAHGVMAIESLFAK